jgi:hypothetical protein
MGRHGLDKGMMYHAWAEPPARGLARHGLICRAKAFLLNTGMMLTDHAADTARFTGPPVARTKKGRANKTTEFM